MGKPAGSCCRAIVKGLLEVAANMAWPIASQPSRDARTAAISTVADSDAELAGATYGAMAAEAANPKGLSSLGTGHSASRSGGAPGFGSESIPVSSS